MTEAPYSIRSVQRVCDILDLVQERPDGLTLIDVADATGLPKSSAFRYLATLEARGYVERNAVGDYLVGLALRSERLDVLVQRARPTLEELRDRLGETINLGMLDAGRVAYIDIVESRRSIRNAPRPGERDFIHSTALGKVLVAWRSAEDVRAILEREGMARKTDRTLLDVDAYLAELAVVRDQGYAVDDRENEPDGRCVAVPVAGTRLPIAISLSAPASRFPVEETGDVAESLLDGARALADITTQSPAAPPAAVGESPIERTTP